MNKHVDRVTNLDCVSVQMQLTYAEAAVHSCKRSQSLDSGIAPDFEFGDDLRHHSDKTKWKIKHSKNCVSRSSDCLLNGFAKESSLNHTQPSDLQSGLSLRIRMPGSVPDCDDDFCSADGIPSSVSSNEDRTFGSSFAEGYMTEDPSNTTITPSNKTKSNDHITNLSGQALELFKEPSKEVLSIRNEELDMFPGLKKQKQARQQTSAKQSWLLRLFESKHFEMSIAIQYLFNSKEPGVQSYIGESVSYVI